MKKEIKVLGVMAIVLAVGLYLFALAAEFRHQAMLDLVGETMGTPVISAVIRFPSIMSANPAASRASSPAASAGPPASCPAGMALVEGDYCFTLRHECLQSIVPTKKREEKFTNPDWLDKCFAYRPGVAECANGNHEFSLNISPDYFIGDGRYDITPMSQFGRSLMGLRAGAKVLGCKLESVDGVVGKNRSVTAGSILTLVCPPAVRLRFCMDVYESPNRAGAMPENYVSWETARRSCEKQGKRLCLEHEWTLACEGQERRPYPYGWRREDAACNIHRCVSACGSDSPDAYVKGRCFQYDPYNDLVVDMPICPNPAKALTDMDPGTPARVIVDALRLVNEVPGEPGGTFIQPSGKYERCVSGFGIRDLTGSVNEWTQCFDHCEKFPSVAKGGHWLDLARNACRPQTTLHGPQYKSPYSGFRCCADAAEPDGGS